MIKMEALAHKGSAEAVTELNSFMKTRQPDYNYTFTNKADLIEEIIYQKRVEFWGEGLEYIDNRRLNIPVDTDKCLSLLLWICPQHHIYKLYLSLNDIHLY